MPTTVTVDRIEVIRSGWSKKTNRPWSLYEVHGAYSDGSPLTNVRTFESLPVGPQELELVHGEKDPGRILARLPQTRAARVPAANGGPGDTRFDQLESRLQRLEKQMLAIINNSEIPLP